MMCQSYSGALILGRKHVCTVVLKGQDDEVGDGTMSMVVLEGELLQEADKFKVKYIHPMTIIEGIVCIDVKPFTFQFSLSNFFSQRNDYAYECRLGHHIDIYICIQKSDTENNVQKGLVSVYH